MTGFLSVHGRGGWLAALPLTNPQRPKLLNVTSYEVRNPNLNKFTGN